MTTSFRKKTVQQKQQLHNNNQWVANRLEHERETPSREGEGYVRNEVVKVESREDTAGFEWAKWSGLVLPCLVWWSWSGSQRFTCWYSGCHWNTRSSDVLWCLDGELRPPFPSLHVAFALCESLSIFHLKRVVTLSVFDVFVTLHFSAVVVVFCCYRDHKCIVCFFASPSISLSFSSVILPLPLHDFLFVFNIWRTKLRRSKWVEAPLFASFMVQWSMLRFLVCPSLRYRRGHCVELLLLFW